MASLDFLTWVRLFVWLAIGLTIYFTYSRHHSHLVTMPEAPAPAKVPTKL
jgi:APA family basic amino acid/polyamine antiporter